MCRKMMWAVLAIGAFGIVAPFALQLPDKTSSGEAMMQAFEPIMDEQNVQTTADYYYDVFVPLGEVAPAMSQANIDRFNAYLAGFGALGRRFLRLVTTCNDAHPQCEKPDQRAHTHLQTDPQGSRPTRAPC